MNSLSELLARYSDLRKEIKTLFSAPNVRDLIAADFTEHLSKLDKVVGIETVHLNYNGGDGVYFLTSDGNIWDEYDAQGMFGDECKPFLKCFNSLPKELLTLAFGIDVKILFVNGKFKVTKL